jgi:ATP-dependent Clp protease protease subunit
MSKHDSEEGHLNRLEERLLRTRTILISEPVSSTLTRRVVTSLLVLDAESPEKPITVVINSPGGSADDGFGILDAMRLVRAPVRTVCVGLAASAATIILLGGEKEHRYVTPSCRILIHQPSSGISGSASDIAITAKEILKLRERIVRLLAEETGQDAERIEKDIHRDHWMSAEEARDYGLFSKVIQSIDELPEA